jgi:hypothetical protein
MHALGRLVDRAALCDVVDATLKDDRGGPVDGGLETDRDLVGSFAVDAAVAKPKPRLDSLRPVLPLARLVAAAT